MRVRDSQMKKTEADRPLQRPAVLKYTLTTAFHLANGKLYIAEKNNIQLRMDGYPKGLTENCTSQQPENFEIAYQKLRILPGRKQLSVMIITLHQTQD